MATERYSFVVACIVLSYVVQYLSVQLFRRNLLKTLIMKCRNCSGSGEDYDIRLLKVVECNYCEGTGLIQSHQDTYSKDAKKRYGKRIAKLGRDFEIKERDEQ